MRFCEKLILLRKRKGMTQQELSRAVGVSRQSVYKWESGQSYPEAPKLLELRRLFEVSIDHLLDESIHLPSPLGEIKVENITEKTKIYVAPPIYAAEIKPEPDPEKEIFEAIAPIVKETKEEEKPEIVKPIAKPQAPTVSVQKKKKKPSTLREIARAFFGKRG